MLVVNARFFFCCYLLDLREFKEREFMEEIVLLRKNQINLYTPRVFIDFNTKQLV